MKSVYLSILLSLVLYSCNSSCMSYKQEEYINRPDKYNRVFYYFEGVSLVVIDKYKKSSISNITYIYVEGVTDSGSSFKKCFQMPHSLEILYISSTQIPTGKYIAKTYRKHNGKKVCYYAEFYVVLNKNVSKGDYRYEFTPINPSIHIVQTLF